MNLRPPAIFKLVTDGKATIIHPYVDNFLVYTIHLWYFMVSLGMGYYCFTNIVYILYIIIYIIIYVALHIALLNILYKVYFSYMYIYIYGYIYIYNTCVCVSHLIPCLASSTGQIGFTNYLKPVSLLRVSLGLHQFMENGQTLNMIKSSQSLIILQGVMITSSCLMTLTLFCTSIKYVRTT